MNVLITGGAGFIGSHLTRRLSAQGAAVTILDSLSPQIHGPSANFTEPLCAMARCVRGDICDGGLMQELLKNQNVVVHLAAETGTGQSMYAVERYSQVNMQGTAVLLDRIVNDRFKSVQKLIVASSRAVYGEGEYVCRIHGNVFPPGRTAENLSAGRFEPLCPECDGDITPVGTTENAPFGPRSFYGLTKQVQEQSVLMFARALGLDAFALRFQNVYGPGQSLTNPYTGILAIFSNLARLGKPINIFEDGLESRDFVYIDDVVWAISACLSPDTRGVDCLNVGSGTRTSVSDVAKRIANHFGSRSPVQVTGDFRIGDIRHNFADVRRLNARTGYSPKWSFDAGLKSFLLWAEQFPPTSAGFDQSLSELKLRGLMASGPSDHA